MGFLSTWASAASRPNLEVEMPVAEPALAGGTSAASTPHNPDLPYTESEKLTTESEKLMEPHARCRCGRALYWRGFGGGWKCMGCTPPAHYDDVQETLMIVTDEGDDGPRGAAEAARSGAIDVLNEIGARMFSIDGAVVVGIPPNADSPEVRSAIECLHLKRRMYLDDHRVPERYRFGRDAS